MPTIKLTKRSVAALIAPDPSGKQTLYWDVELKGFGVLVSGRTGIKSYVVQHRLQNGANPRVTIAPTNVIDLDEARDRAKAVIGSIYAGEDPRGKKRAARKPRTGTLRQTLTAYLHARKDLRERSRAGYRYQIEHHLAPWLDRPLSEVTPEMVEERHALIKGTVERRAARRAMVNGNATANATFRAFRALWNFAADRDPTLGTNPVQRLQRQRLWYPVDRREGLVPAERLADFYQALLALPNQVQSDFLMLILFTGLRRTEAAALKWDEVDLTSRVIRLPPRRTKAARKLDLPMSDFVHGLLLARRTTGREESRFVFAADSGSGHVEEPQFPLRLVAEATGVKACAAHRRPAQAVGGRGRPMRPRVVLGTSE